MRARLATPGLQYLNALSGVACITVSSEGVKGRIACGTCAEEYVAWNSIAEVSAEDLAAKS
ncbi:hypothetical protein P171DRAFT_437670 [Karstenula rhodostoma CBS 690.94]|uniref:Uncharacterized protein n=1 Tax=Karstenula rhodostoma CBS 690.94 TaxID=1392251 RepID=A0A9P4P544_9PLEO|nr:hypothetical protein P171DRAFT_437670 [Karstenula rhodostoma CBS 690.94]